VATVDLNEAQAQLIQAVSQAEGSDEAQALLAGLEESGGAVLLKRLIYFAERSGSGTEFLEACALLANDRGVREEAGAALRRLTGRNGENDPAPNPALESLKTRRLKGAWLAEAQDGCKKLLTLWEREGKRAQAYVFDLDGEGALVGFEATPNLEPTQAAGLVEESECRRLKRAEMKEMLRRSFSVTFAKELDLPADYLRQRHYLEYSIFKQN